LLDFAQTPGNVELLLYEGQQNVHADGNPDLGLHRIFGGAIEGLDSKVLFDPLEEQLDLPATLVDLGDGQGGEEKIVGKEHQAFVCGGIHKAN